MDEDTQVPRFSYDLIDWLDNVIANPSLPRTAEGFAALDDKDIRRSAFQSGARSLVEMLKAWRDEEEDEDADNDTEFRVDRFGSILRPDHELDRGTSGTRVAEVDAPLVSSDPDQDTEG